MANASHLSIPLAPTTSSHDPGHRRGRLLRVQQLKQHLEHYGVRRRGGLPREVRRARRVQLGNQSKARPGQWRWPGLWKATLQSHAVVRGQPAVVLALQLVLDGSLGGALLLLLLIAGQTLLLLGVRRGRRRLRRRRRRRG